VSPQQGARIRAVLEGLAKLPGGGSGGAAPGLLAQLEEQVASECPWNGEVTVRLLDLPFVSPEDSEELASWAL
jgi:hypothetical protein